MFGYKVIVGFFFFLAVFSDLFTFVNKGVSAQTDFPVVFFALFLSFFLCERLLPKNVFKTNGGLILWLSSIILLALSIPSLLDHVFLDFISNWLFFAEGYFHFQDLARALILVFVFLPYPILILGWKHTVAIPPQIELLIIIACCFIPQSLMVIYGLKTVVLVLSGLLIVFGEFERPRRIRKLSTRSVWLILPMLQYCYNWKQEYYDHQIVLLVFFLLWLGKPSLPFKRIAKKLTHNILFFLILYCSVVILFSLHEGIEVMLYLGLIYFLLPIPPRSASSGFDIFASILFLCMQFESPLAIFALSYFLLCIQFCLRLLKVGAWRRFILVLLLCIYTCTSSRYIALDSEIELPRLQKTSSRLFLQLQGQVLAKNYDISKSVENVYKEGNWFLFNDLKTNDLSNLYYLNWMERDQTGIVTSSYLQDSLRVQGKKRWELLTRQLTQVYTVFNFHEIFLLEQFKEWFEFFKKNSVGGVLVLTKDSYNTEQLGILLSMYSRFYPGAKVQIRDDAFVIAWNLKLNSKQVGNVEVYPTMSIFSFLDVVKSRAVVYRYELLEYFIKRSLDGDKAVLDLSKWRGILDTALYFYEVGYFSLALEYSSKLLEIDSLNEEYIYFNALLKQKQKSHHYEKFYFQWVNEDEPGLPADPAESILRKVFQTRYMWDWYNTGINNISSRSNSENYWFDILIKLKNQDVATALVPFEKSEEKSRSRLHQKIIKNIYEVQGKTKDALLYED